MNATNKTVQILDDVKIDVKINVGGNRRYSNFRRIFIRNGNMDGNSECYGLPVTGVES